MNLYTTAFRNIRRNNRRSILSASAIMIAAMSIVLLFSLLAGMKADMRFNVTSFISGQVRVRHARFDEHELLGPLHLNIAGYQALASELRQAIDGALISPRISFRGIADPNNRKKPVNGKGVLFDVEEDFQNLSAYLVAGEIPAAGSNGIVMGTRLAQELDLEVGDRITISNPTMRRGQNFVTYTVSALAAWPVAHMNRSTFYAPLDQIQRVSGMGATVTELLVKSSLSDADTLKQVQQNIAGQQNLSARGWEEIDALSSWMSIADIIYAIMALFFFILASTVIINTTMMVIYERIREIGTLGAMGMEGGRIIKLFFIEAFYLGLIGTTLGLLLGISITGILSITGLDFSMAMEGADFDIGNIIYPKLNLRSTIGVFFYSLVIASAASLIPSRRAAKIEPVEALRHS